MNIPVDQSVRGFLAKPAYGLNELLELQPCGRTFVYEEIKAGRLRATKAGRRTIFLADDVASWLESLRTSGDVSIRGVHHCDWKSCCRTVNKKGERCHWHAKKAVVSTQPGADDDAAAD